MSVFHDIKGAWVSSCEKYRYTLDRVWDFDAGIVVFIMLNPSTADAYQDDPTIRRCISFAKHWGYGGIRVVNLFAYRATNPDYLNELEDPIGEHNKEIIETVCKSESNSLIVCAWGSKVPKKYPKTPKHVLRLLKRLNVKARVFKFNKDGNPAHPLYLKSDIGLEIIEDE